MTPIKSPLAPLLSVNNLTVAFQTPTGPFVAVDHVSFNLNRGETLALVGESGSGKSVTALSILQLLPPSTTYAPGSSIQFMGQELVGANEPTLRSIRGAKIGMVFQEPLTSLNPLHTIEHQIIESIRLHQPHLTRDAVRARLDELLDLVELNQLKNRLGAYPHELSGGQRQRVMIAMSLANTPDLLIADEPTTALDVTIQAEILKLLDDLKRRHNMALLIITHDLSIVEKMADHVCVMRHGKIIEHGPTQALFTAPQHAYTSELLHAHPTSFAPAAPTNAPVVMTGQDIRVAFPRGKTWWGSAANFVYAVNGVHIEIKAGHTLGIVGESGSGKTTLALALLRLVPATGPVVFMGQRIDTLTRSALRPLRAKMQIVFQDPFGSLSPRMSVGDIIGEGLAVHAQHITHIDRDHRIADILKRVGLDPETRHRYPHEFSGGQRQRIAIARAAILNPAVILMDEPTSALDVVVQAQIVELLKDLQRERGLAYLFISHDLRVIRALAHDVIVMKDGHVIEQGATQTIFNTPQMPYTRLLLDAALNLKTLSA